MGTKPTDRASFRAAGHPVHRRSENLALVFQEMFTAIVRLRSNRQAVASAESLRAQVRGALKKAEQDATSRGYTGEDIRLATFAVVAFLDESILNSRNPVFADWPRKPLQEELFGGHVAGEIFFQNLDRLLGRKDSDDLADLLEVYNLCLLLGYRGRYTLSGPEALRSIIDLVAEKIRRIRGPSQALSPAWAPSGQPVRVNRSDPWIRRLQFGAAACLLLALVLFVGFKISLGSGASDLHIFASGASR